jgi:hypothetical protein
MVINGVHVVDIGYISASLDEEKSMRDELMRNGIRVWLDGSCAYSILVPEYRKREAIGILRTNRLVLIGKVKLYDPKD